MIVFGWRLSKVLGFCFCGVLMPGFLIWRVETGDDPDRTLGFFVSGCVIGGFAKVLYELFRARGAYKLLVYDKRRSNPLLLPLVTVMGLVGWSGQSGEPWRWAYPLLPIATWASTLRAPPRPPPASGRSQRPRNLPAPPSSD